MPDDGQKSFRVTTEETGADHRRLESNENAFAAKKTRRLGKKEKLRRRAIFNKPAIEYLSRRQRLRDIHVPSTMSCPRFC